MALNRSTLYVTTDGGSTWREAIPYARANISNSSVGPVYFVGARYGWSAAWPNRLFRTTDGGWTWVMTQVQ